MDLHPDLAPLAFLVGSWTGRGEGSYPTIAPFAYHEEIDVGHVGKPFLSYVQRTRHATTGLPLHSESGYLRSVDDGKVELVIAQPSGIVEVHSGRVEDAKIDLASLVVATTPSAKPVEAVRRVIELLDEELHTRLWMAAVGQPLQLHLSASFQRDHS
jgi:hypothetical protein